ncbi:MaoC/PaaZ C-terminal domain-containing protein [Cupriavidus necator]|uniref:MaoC/PaaZ C-terminal domain-containing protein n=1 Tax=Cupriavidus necator TaxID=106590 RepID=UPI0039C1A826
MAPGQSFQTGVHQLDADQIKTFAAEFDPQPFHMDETAALDSIFRGLSASGWHTAALTMKLLATGDFHPAGAFIGAGIEEFQWPRPVRPDDALSVEVEVLDARVSKSKPIVKARCTSAEPKQ